jgi:hypothetical protein
MAVTMLAFLPPVSARSRIPGSRRSRWNAVAVPPVKITVSTSGWVARRWAAVSLSPYTNWSARWLTPADQKHWHRSQAVATVSGAGFRMTVLPAASAAATPPQGIAIGKFQGGTTATTPRPDASAPGRSARTSALRA